MKSVTWDEMLTHDDYDAPWGRAFSYFHRDMGEVFQHEASGTCPCGPIRVSLCEDQTRQQLYRVLDKMSHEMVN